jgi:hypothetical protein
MMRLMLAGFVAIATFAATTAVLRSHPPGAHQPVGLSSQELSTPAAREPLPVEVMDDLTFVSPTEKKQ